MNVMVCKQGQPGRGVTLARVREAATQMLTTLKLPRAEISIVLCDDPVIHALNRTWRHKDKPTDVLAFALREGEHGALAGDALGDVIISVPTATRQASENHHSLEHEVLMLLAHGTLHLLGWDHQNDADDLRMRREVDRLVAAASSLVPAVAKPAVAKPAVAKPAVAKPVKRAVQKRPRGAVVQK